MHKTPKRKKIQTLDSKDIAIERNQDTMQNNEVLLTLQVQRL